MSQDQNLPMSVGGASLGIMQVIQSICLRKNYLKKRCVHFLRMSTVLPNEETGQEGSMKVKPFSEIPGPRWLHRIPYLGSALLFKPFTPYQPADITDMLGDLRDKYGDIYRIRLGKDDWVFINNLDFAKTVLQAQYTVHDRIHVDLWMKYWERSGKPPALPDTDGHEWYAMRKPLQDKMLRPAVAALYVPLIDQVTNDFVQRLSKMEVIEDLFAELNKYTLESVGMLCFHKRLNSFKDTSGTSAIIGAAIAKIFQLVQETFFMPVKTFMYFETKLYKEFAKQTDILTDIAAKELTKQKEFIKELEKEGKLKDYLEKEPYNFLYSLLSDPRITMDQISGLVSNLFIAGIDSTSKTLLFLLAELALNPDKQEKLYQEIQEVVGDSKTLTKEHLAQMPYLKACSKESLRKTFPIFIGPIRILEFDLVVGGYLIPKSTIVGVNMQLMSMDERYYPKPKEFIPERWLRGTTGEIAKGQLYPIGQKPFGFGARSCVGQRFAENEIQICVTKIIQNFQISMPPGVREVKVLWQMFAGAADAVAVHLKKRKPD